MASIRILGINIINTNHFTDSNEYISWAESVSSANTFVQKEVPATHQQLNGEQCH